MEASSLPTQHKPPSRTQTTLGGGGGGKYNLRSRKRPSQTKGSAGTSPLPASAPPP
eukprot:CAMPEP_0174906200 /NCGR_PEP_ID=MMETSP0167-20121228/56065_1 /TAXON_ID=38298 /ORGANISM="Rhodella maculata, Strain CCMP736" /LENGTH=55 /DNA_ID=CAMNT_0016149385 /DNA_START=1 /DNA_END=165 /DNA_ORIENTATION=+